MHLSQFILLHCSARQPQLFSKCLLRIAQELPPFSKFIRCDSDTGKPNLAQTQLKLDLQAQTTRTGLQLAGYATNIKGHDYNRRVYHPDGKAPTLAAASGGNLEPKTLASDTTWRKLTPVEVERLQTVPDNYTAHVSNTQRYKMLGNGFTVDVISQILQGIQQPT